MLVTDCWSQVWDVSNRLNWKSHKHEKSHRHNYLTSKFSSKISLGNKSATILLIQNDNNYLPIVYVELTTRCHSPVFDGFQNELWWCCVKNNVSQIRENDKGPDEGTLVPSSRFSHLKNLRPYVRWPHLRRPPRKMWWPELVWTKLTMVQCGYFLFIVLLI